MSLSNPNINRYFVGKTDKECCNDCGYPLKTSKAGGLYCPRFCSITAKKNREKDLEYRLSEAAKNPISLNDMLPF